MNGKSRLFGALCCCILLYCCISTAAAAAAGGPAVEARRKQHHFRHGVHKLQENNSSDACGMLQFRQLVVSNNNSSDMSANNSFSSHTNATTTGTGDDGSSIIYVLRDDEQNEEVAPYTRLAIISGSPNRHYIRNYAWATQTKRCYVSRFANYSFILETGPFDFLPNGTLPHYNKAFLLKKHLRNYEWVMWMDLDAFFQSFTASLEPFLTNNHGASVVVQDFAPYSSMNNGIFFVKNTTQGEAFLDLWIDMQAHKCNSYKWDVYDQSAFIEAVLVTMSGLRKPNTTAYDNRCQSLSVCTGEFSEHRLCTDGVLEALGYPHAQRNEHPNNAIHFWSRPFNETGPHRAFGFFRIWVVPINTCLETDLCCHGHYDAYYYVYSSNKIRFSNTSTSLSPPILVQCEDDKSRSQQRYLLKDFTLHAFASQDAFLKKGHNPKKVQSMPCALLDSFARGDSIS